MGCLSPLAPYELNTPLVCRFVLVRRGSQPATPMLWVCWTGSGGSRGHGRHRRAHNPLPPGGKGQEGQMTMRICACGQLHEGRVGRCPQRAAARARGEGRVARSTWAWRQASLRQRRAQPSCEQCGTDKDLTTDHTKPLSKGGHITDQPLQTLCRRCNSKKGNKPDTSRG